MVTMATVATITSVSTSLLLGAVATPLRPAAGLGKAAAKTLAIDDEAWKSRMTLGDALTGSGTEGEDLLVVTTARWLCQSASVMYTLGGGASLLVLLALECWLDCRAGGRYGFQSGGDSGCRGTALWLVRSRKSGTSARDVYGPWFELALSRCVVGLVGAPIGVGDLKGAANVGRTV